MTVLGIDGALDGFSAAVARDGKGLAHRLRPGNVALEGGLSAVAEALREADVSPAQLERVAVGIGPGGFTGLRIALSYAKSLAQGWRRPLVGVNSFDALEARLPSGGPLLTVVRGRPGVISARIRSADQTERRESGYTADVLDALTSDITGTLRVVNAPEDVLAALGERGIHVQSISAAVQPAALAVALVSTGREPARSLHELRADYGELPAAKLPKQ